jgi:hypothetical protein
VHRDAAKGYTSNPTHATRAEPEALTVDRHDELAAAPGFATAKPEPTTGRTNALSSTAAFPQSEPPVQPPRRPPPRFLEHGVPRLDKLLR